MATLTKRRVVCYDSHMKIEKWICKHTNSLKGRTVAITGATGGIGEPLCQYFVLLGADLVLLNRNAEKTKSLCVRLKALVPTAQIRCISLDLSDMESVRQACTALESDPPDILIHNAGVYSVPRYITPQGYDNVFQINFAAPYYMTKRLMPFMAKKEGARVVVVGSIAYRYAKSDYNDIDFQGRKRAALVYGNAKRYLMFAMQDLFHSEERVTLAVAHPGITFTNITSHYPKFIFALIKHPMKLIFMKPRKACLSILRACFEPCVKGTWIGPRVGGIWGFPKTSQLTDFTCKETLQIYQTAERIYKELLESEEKSLPNDKK